VPWIKLGGVNCLWRSAGCGLPVREIGGIWAGGKLTIIFLLQTRIVLADLLFQIV